jgi:hypothetical protein
MFAGLESLSIMMSGDTLLVVCFSFTQPRTNIQHLKRKKILNKRYTYQENPSIFDVIYELCLILK